jgi:hypothetical protein
VILKRLFPVLTDPRGTFQRAALQQTEFLNQSDAFAATDARNLVVDAARKIYATEEDRGKAFFTEMLNHSAREVRYWAVMAMFTIDPTIALEALKDDLNSRDIEARSQAMQTVKEWESGELTSEWIRYSGNKNR